MFSSELVSVVWPMRVSSEQAVFSDHHDSSGAAAGAGGPPRRGRSLLLLLLRRVTLCAFVSRVTSVIRVMSVGGDTMKSFLECAIVDEYGTRRRASTTQGTIRD